MHSRQNSRVVHENDDSEFLCFVTNLALKSQLLKLLQWLFVGIAPFPPAVSIEIL